MLSRLKCLLFGHDGDQFTDECWRASQAQEGQVANRPPRALFTVTYSDQSGASVAFKSWVCRRCGVVYARRAQ